VKLRFQADADLKEDIAKGVMRREPEIDFRTATSASLSRLSDLEVLTLAAEEGRILVSHDRKTMPQTFGRFIQSRMRVDQSHGGNSILEACSSISGTSDSTSEYSRDIHRVLSIFAEPKWDRWKPRPTEGQNKKGR